MGVSPMPLCFDHTCSVPASLASSRKPGVGGAASTEGSAKDEDHYSTPTVRSKSENYQREKVCKTPSEHHYDVPLLKTPSQNSPKSSPCRSSPMPLSENFYLLSPPQPPGHARGLGPRTTPTLDSGVGGNEWRVESSNSSLEKQHISASRSTLNDSTSGKRSLPNL